MDNFFEAFGPGVANVTFFLTFIGEFSKVA